MYKKTKSKLLHISLEVFTIGVGPQPRSGRSRDTNLDLGPEVS